MTVFGTDDRQPLKDLDADNVFLPPLVHISIDKNGEEYVGTGFMIAPNVLLTAKHVITDTANAFEYNPIFSIGRDGNNFEFGKAEAKNAYHYTSTTIPSTGSPEDFQRDWVVINLDRNVGDFTNWLNIAIPPSDYVGSKVEILGYPVQVDGEDNFESPELMYTPTGTITDDNDFMFFSDNLDISGGNSGGPIIDFNTLTTVAINTAESPNLNWFLKITQEMIDGLNLYKGADFKPIDYPDLAPKENVFQDDGAMDYIIHNDNLATISDDHMGSFTLEVGEEMVVRSSVYNVGTAAPVEDATIKWYFSADKNITKDDINFHTTTLSKEDLDPFQTVVDKDLWTNDGSIEAGSYWVGYEIEYSGQEFDKEGYSFDNISLLDGNKVIIEEGDINIGSPVFRFYNTDNSGHFFTANKTEAEYVNKNLDNYDSEGISFYSVAPDKGDVVYRFFNPTNGSHLYTTDENEKQYVLDNLTHYKFEDIGFYAHETQEAGTIEVHRFYRPSLGSHIYTSDLNEVDYIKNNLSDLYNYENVAFYAYENDVV